jgi:hypothetical protein
MSDPQVDPAHESWKYEQNRAIMVLPLAVH